MVDKNNTIEIDEETEITEPDAMPQIIMDLGENAVLGQIRNEYKLAYDFLLPKISEWLVRLKLYNNQRRDAADIGDPLLFTVFNTLLASLYEDKLQSEWLPREEGDIEVAENLNALTEFDFDAMGKDQMDYDWIWDAMFFGRGLLLMETFDRKLMHPIPEVIDPCTFLRDPKATSINGDMKGFNGCRFWGREIQKSKIELENSDLYFNVDQLKSGQELQSFIRKAREERRDAQGLASQPFKEDADKNNPSYDLLEWRTHLKGEKYLVTLGNMRSTIVRVQKMKDQNQWAVIDRQIFPMAHNWDGVSVPDLVEDKQRAKAVLENLMLKSAKADVLPMYIFDQNKITNITDLNFGYNKFIRSSGPANQAIATLNKPTIHQHVSSILSLMDINAQKALATPELSQGVPSAEKRTLGEQEIVQSEANNRHNLSARIFGWSEKRYWRQWYSLYKEHFKSKIDTKTARIMGVFGPEFRPLKRDNIIAKVDPDIKIESKVSSELQRIRKQKALTGFIMPFINDPDTNRRLAKKELAKANGLKNSLIKMLFPPTVDELTAEDENDMIDKGIKPIADIREDHQEHIMIHSKLNESPMRDKHIKAHREAMLLKRKNARLFASMDAAERPDVRPLSGQEEKSMGLPKEAPVSGRGQPALQPAV